MKHCLEFACWMMNGIAQMIMAVSFMNENTPLGVFLIACSFVSFCNAAISLRKP